MKYRQVDDENHIVAGFNRVGSSSVSGKGQWSSPHHAVFDEKGGKQVNSFAEEDILDSFGKAPRYAGE